MMNSDDSALTQIAAFASGLEIGCVPLSVQALSRHLILDSIGVMFAGLSDPLADKLRVWAGSQGEGRVASMVGRSLVARDAALVNASVMHVLDFDDAGFGGHGTSSVLPACLAVGVPARISELDLLAAYAAGMEVFGKVAAFGEHVDVPGGGWHATNVHGVLGAAAGAARAAGLDAPSTAHALAIAASSGSGVRAALGTMVKALHAGFAASSGVRAVEFAAVGITGGDAMLDSDGGFGRAYFEGALDWLALAESLGQPFRMAASGPSIKSWPFCSGTQRPIATLLGMLEEHGLEPGDVASIEIHVAPRLLRVLSFDWPRDRYEAKFSLRFSLAAVASGRLLDPGLFDDATFADAEFERWRERIVVVADRPELKQSSELLLTTSTGVVHRAASGVLHGTAQDPMEEHEVVAKYRRSVGGYLGDKSAEQLEAAVLNLGVPGNDFWSAWSGALRQTVRPARSVAYR